ncbi:hypothetical protein [Silanimonas algicola]
MRRKLATHFFCVNNFAHIFFPASSPNTRDLLARQQQDDPPKADAIASDAENKGINRDLKNADAARETSKRLKSTPFASNHPAPQIGLKGSRNAL